MTMKIVVVLNEQHSLLQEQVKLLDKEFEQGNWLLCSVPATGWTLEEQETMVINLSRQTIVFASPVPYLLAKLAYEKGQANQISKIFVFGNDNRDKKELPGGRVVYVVPKTGWQLLKI